MKPLSPQAQALADVENALGLTKLSARAGVNRLRGLYDAAHKATDEASRHHIFNQIGQLENRAGDILHGRHLPQGSQMKILGAGGEGVAQHVLTPHGSRVQKTLDPTSSLFNPTVNENRRSLIGKDTPGFAKTLAHGQAPHTVNGEHAPTFQYDYVPGKAVDKADPGVAKLKQQAHQGQHGMEFADVRHDNMLKDIRTGEVKGIDYTPVNKNDMLPMNRRGDAKFFNENVDFSSPTGLDFRHHKEQSGQVAPGIRDAAQNRIVDQVVGKGMPKGLQDQYLNDEMDRLQKGYAGNVLGQAYGGKQPQSFRARPVPSFHDHPTQGAGVRPTVQPENSLVGSYSGPPLRGQTPLPAHLATMPQTQPMRGGTANAMGTAPTMPVAPQSSALTMPARRPVPR